MTPSWWSVLLAGAGPAGPKASWHVADVHLTLIAVVDSRRWGHRLAGTCRVSLRFSALPLTPLQAYGSILFVCELWIALKCPGWMIKVACAWQYARVLMCSFYTQLDTIHASLLPSTKGTSIRPCVLQGNLTHLLFASLSCQHGNVVGALVLH